MIRIIGRAKRAVKRTPVVVRRVEALVNNLLSRISILRCHFKLISTVISGVTRRETR